MGGGYSNCSCFVNLIENEPGLDDDRAWIDHELKQKKLHEDVLKIDVICFDDQERDH